MAIRVPDITSRIRVDTTGLDKAQTETKRFSSGVVGALKVASAAAAGYAAFNFAKQAVADAQEARKVANLTAAALKSTGGAAKVSAEQIADHAGELANLTGIDDAVIQAGENMLLTFTKVRNEVGRGNDVFTRATELGLDMSVALGTDAKSAALQLGKALNDPIKGVTALSRAGVSFTQQQRDQIKTLVETGDLLSAQKIILGELETQFGGAAAAAADPSERLAYQLGEVREALGTLLLPAIDAAADGLNGLVTGFQNVGDAADAVQGFIEDNATVVGGLAGALTASAIPALVRTADSARILASVKLLEWADGIKSAAGAVVKPLTDIVSRMRAARAAGAGLAGTVAAGLTPGVIGFGIAVSGAALLLNHWVKEKQKAKQAAEDYTRAIELDSGALAENTRATVVNRLEQEGTLALAQKLGVSGELVADAVLNEAGARETLTRILRENYGGQQNIAQGDRNLQVASVDLAAAVGVESEILEGSADAAYRKAAALGEAESAASGAGTASRQMASEMLSVAGEVDSAGRKVRNMAEALDNFRTAMDRAFGRALNVEEATSNLEAATDDLTASFKENGETLDLSTEKGRANRQAIRDRVRAAQELIFAERESGATVKETNEIAKEQRQRLREVLEQVTDNKDEIKRYTEAIKNVPKKAKTTAELATERALERLREYREALEALPATLRTGVHASAIRDEVTGTRGREHGGPVKAGRVYKVGEKRAEYFVPNVDGVINNGKHMAQSSGDTVLQVNVTGRDLSNPRQTADETVRKMQGLVYSLGPR